MLIAIFKTSIYWGGSEPPLIYFIFSGNKPNGEDDVLASANWRIWNFARFDALTFVSSYYIYWLIIYQICSLAQVVDASVSNSLDLGSNPRSFTFSIIFFKSVSHAALIMMYTIFHPYQAYTRPRGSMQWFRLEAHHGYKSICHAWSKMVNKFKAWWAIIPRPFTKTPP